jgi:hypothetical protein
MKGRELDRVLALADELVEQRGKLRRIEHLQQEIQQEREIELRAPDVVRAACSRRGEIERITRSLEDQWVSQGPLVEAWQRAIDLAEQAEYAGADASPYRADVEEARHRVETARLQTREELERLASEREALVDVALAAPIELPLCDAVHDDGRPEAARQDALALAEYARTLEGTASEAHEQAQRIVAEARAELAELGDRGAVEGRIEELEAALPATVELPADAPSSAEMRLQRAAIAVMHT